MRYGFYLPTRGPTATRGGILALARDAGPVRLLIGNFGSCVANVGELSSTPPA
jgi:hypothetical protein